MSWSLYMFLEDFEGHILSPKSRWVVEVRQTLMILDYYITPNKNIYCMETLKWQGILSSFLQCTYAFYRLFVQLMCDLFVSIMSKVQNLIEKKGLLWVIWNISELLIFHIFPQLQKYDISIWPNQVLFFFKKLFSNGPIPLLEKQTRLV